MLNPFSFFDIPMPLANRAGRFVRERKRMRDVMLLGGASWSDTQSALAEEYPDSTLQELYELDQKDNERNA